MPELPPRIGHHRILGALESGFLCDVYRAETEGIGRGVVLKVLRTAAGKVSASHRRFEREARLLSGLRHPNVVELLDFDEGVAGERPPHMVLEYVEGASLGEVLARTPRLSPEEAAAIGLEIARGLAYAHARGVVHRDVKPGNVLIGRTGQQADSSHDRIVVKVSDFGIALEGAEDSEAGDAVGTPAFMAPEQLLGEVVDHRADQFALGIVLYQMLAGARPFDGDDGRPAIQRVRRDPPRPFRQQGVVVPRGIERIAMRCLGKRPADRYDSTDDLVQELTTFLAERLTADLSPLHRRVLSRAGFLDERRSVREESIDPARARRAPLRPRAVPLRPTVAGIVACAIAMLGGGVALELRHARANKAALASGSPLAEHGPAGYVRVLCRPWARVSIDGTEVDTTPIGRLLRVRPGRHVFTFKHPQATEKRAVEVGVDQTVTVEVVLPVPQPAHPDEFLPPPVPSSSASASASASQKPESVPSTLAPLDGGP